MVVFLDEHGRLPLLLPHQGREPLFHVIALPGIPVSALRRTHPSRLQWGRSSLPLPFISGPWPE
jgi:hypothetical protein